MLDWNSGRLQQLYLKAPLAIAEEMVHANLRYKMLDYNHVSRKLTSQNKEVWFPSLEILLFVDLNNFNTFCHFTFLIRSYHGPELLWIFKHKDSTFELRLRSSPASKHERQDHADVVNYKIVEWHSERNESICYLLPQCFQSTFFLIWSYIRYIKLELLFDFRQTSSWQEVALTSKFSFTARLCSCFHLQV